MYIAKTLSLPESIMEPQHLVRASDISRKKKQNFAGFSGANSRKNRPISREKSQKSQKNRPISRDFSGKKSIFEGFQGQILRKNRLI